MPPRRVRESGAGVATPKAEAPKAEAKAGAKAKPKTEAPKAVVAERKSKGTAAVLTKSDDVSKEVVMDKTEVKIEVKVDGVDVKPVEQDAATGLFTVHAIRTRPFISYRL